MRYFIIPLFMFLFVHNQVKAQIEAFYSFDNCDLSDAAGNFDDATTSVNFPECVCGLTENGLYLDGNSNQITFPDTLIGLLEGDFTISFYARFDQSDITTDIFSVRSTCNLDSLMAITYQPLNGQITFTVSQNVTSFESIIAPLDTTRCWHRFVISKSGIFYDFYIDDVLAGSILADQIVQFTEVATMNIANSPCLAINQERFQGWIDDFQFYSRALSATEIVSTSLNPDLVITNDTTIIQGASTSLNIGATCADNITWTPAAGLSDANISNPVATPVTSTTYVATFDYQDGCRTQDDVIVNVLAADDKDCENILLPNAFTPNGDGLNDDFGISNLFIIDDVNSFQIFDRWGAKMWEENNKEARWDGSFKGSPVNPGTYLYKISYVCNGMPFSKIDNFTVLR